MARLTREGTDAEEDGLGVDGDGLEEKQNTHGRACVRAGGVPGRGRTRRWRANQGEADGARDAPCCREPKGGGTV
jgi:hypothetical protein